MAAPLLVVCFLVASCSVVLAAESLVLAQRGVEAVQVVAVDHLQVLGRTQISIASSLSPWNSCLLQKENGRVVEIVGSESDAFENENGHEIDGEVQ